jgi:hypothetical protein
MLMKELIRPFMPKRLHPRNLAYNRIIRHSRGRVISGPFAGQIYLTDDTDFIEPAMLMGTYEKELYPSIELLLRSPPTLFIDVGAAQGYFAVGFARRAHHSRHIAFEFHEPRVAQLKRTAVANAVTIEWQGQCTPELLNSALQQADSTFVMCDVEGYESELIDPASSPLLRQAKMIIETHELVFGGNTTEQIIKRFESTHDINVVKMRRRTAEDLPFYIRDRWTVQQLDEGRLTAQNWLVMNPRTF